MKLSAKGKSKFDAKKVAEGVRKGSIRALTSAAAYTRAVAKNSIKKKKNPNAASAPGTAPHAHGKGKNIKESVLFGVKKEEQSAVIGPAALGGDPKLAQVGALHEFGGTRPNKQPAKRIPGDWDTAKSGPIRVEKGVFVFAKLLTDRQRARAWRIEASGGRFPTTKDKKERLIRKMMKEEQRKRLVQERANGQKPKNRAVYPARPFMKPTLDKMKPMLPAFWSGVIK